jgi:carbonic anhydrase
LLTYPWIKDALNQGTLALSGWYFDFDGGDLLSFNPESNTFEPVASGTSALLNNHGIAEAVEINANGASSMALA